MKKRKLWVSIVAGILAAAMLLGMILSLIPTKAHAASSSEIKKQINALKQDQKDLKNQMEEVQGQYEENEDEILNMVNKKYVIDQEIFLLYGQIGNINQQIASFSLLIADKQDELDEAEQRLEDLNEKYRDRIRAMEEDGELSYWSVLFKASSFSDFLDRLNMIDEIAAADQRRLKEMDEAAEQVALAQEELLVEKAELDATKAELDATYETLAEKQAEAQEILNELIARGVELEEMYAEIEAAEQALLDEIALKEQEYIEASEAEYIAYMATYTTVPPATTTGNESGGGSEEEGGGSEEEGGSEATEATKPASTKWLVPCSYRMLTSPFGDRERPTAGASTNHKGVDLAGPEGTPIYASRTGVVTTATSGRSAGLYVTINHGDGYSSVYMHMSNYVVKRGQAVSAGQLIGYMGSTGISTGSHLHFGIMYNGSYVNPANYVSLHP